MTLHTNDTIHSILKNFDIEIGEHAVVGKETLKFESIFGSLPDFPSLRPQVKRERTEIGRFQ
jgi:hypothetical protein